VKVFTPENQKTAGTAGTNCRTQHPCGFATDRHRGQSGDIAGTKRGQIENLLNSEIFHTYIPFSCCFPPVRPVAQGWQFVPAAGPPSLVRTVLESGAEKAFPRPPPRRAAGGAACAHGVATSMGRIAAVAGQDCLLRRILIFCCMIPASPAEPPPAAPPHASRVALCRHAWHVHTHLPGVQ